MGKRVKRVLVDHVYRCTGVHKERERLAAQVDLRAWTAVVSRAAVDGAQLVVNHVAIFAECSVLVRVDDVRVDARVDLMETCAILVAAAVCIVELASILVIRRRRRASCASAPTDGRKMVALAKTLASTSSRSYALAILIASFSASLSSVMRATLRRNASMPQPTMS